MYLYICCLLAWNDGKIRVFAPESGRLMLIINNAHKMGVTAIAGTRNCKRIVSGGGEGQVSMTHRDKMLEGSWSSLKQKADVSKR